MCRKIKIIYKFLAQNESIGIWDGFCIPIFLDPLLIHKYKDNVHSFYRNEKRYARIYIVLKETLYEINIMECKWNQSLYQ